MKPFREPNVYVYVRPRAGNARNRYDATSGREVTGVGPDFDALFRL